MAAGIASRSKPGRGFHTHRRHVRSTGMLSGCAHSASRPAAVAAGHLTHSIRVVPTLHLRCRVSRSGPLTVFWACPSCLLVGYNVLLLLLYCRKINQINCVSELGDEDPDAGGILGGVVVSPGTAGQRQAHSRAGTMLRPAHGSRAIAGPDQDKYVPPL